MFYFIIQ